MRRGCKYLIVAIVLFAGALVAGCQSERRSLPPARPSETATAVPTNTPQPLPATFTATASPTTTLTPSLTPQLTPQERLREDFSQEQTCLETVDNEEASGGVTEGAYVLEVKTANATVGVNCETVVVGDLNLEVEARLLNAPEGAAYYMGVLFRVSGTERYAFAVGSEGGYCAYYASDQAFVPLTNSTDFATPCWVRAPEDALDEDGHNLRVMALGDRIDLYLNGVLLAVVRDHKLREGWVGLVVATSEEGGVVVAFDNLRVGRP